MNENLINESLSDEFMQALVESDSDKYKKINNSNFTIYNN